MFKIWALVIEVGDEMNVTLFWRFQDCIEVLPEILAEYIEDADVAAHAGLLMRDTAKLFSYLEEQDLFVSLDEVEIEGRIDGKQLKKLEKLVVGPRLVKEPAEKRPRKIKAASGCRTIIDGVEV